ncbi:MAG: STAS domain-containing protein [Planctomycetota bacterium]
MLDVCKSQDKQVIRFEGRMDTDKCAKIETEVRTAVSGSSIPIIFDLDGVDFISSAFLRFCIYGQQQAGDHGFQIVNVGPCIKRVFKIAGLDAMLKAE